ncbi:unnamed protein product [Dovyalis caffra]|uniref:Uncharacterized protein n=1 Tax=Dovyalis caffra TaxID=77055 RepID=A0AAV1RQI1_9ROSI|nr:unnamed protein product [Dovyalis caffra]
MSQTEYKVKENLMPLLRNILGKYGDIAANYIMKTPEGRSSVLEDVCGLIYTFQEKKFGELTLFQIENAVAIVTDFERAGLKVDWLKQTLEDILETRKVIKQPTSLKEARYKTNQVINEKKRKLEEYEALMGWMVVFQEKTAMLQQNVSLTKKELHAAKTKAERINETISNAKAKVIYHTEHSPLNELL